MDVLLGILNQLFVAVASGKRVGRRLCRQAAMLLDCIRERGCIVSDGINRGGNLLVKPVEFVTDLIDGQRLLCFLPSGADLITLGFAEPRELRVALHGLQESSTRDGN